MESLRNALDVLGRRRLVVFVSLIIGLAVMTLALIVVPKTYEATASVLIVADSNGRDPSVTSIDLPSVATSTVVLSRVMDDLKLPMELTALKRSVKAHVSARSSIMQISYRDTQPDRAVAVPNTVADELSRYYESISTSRADATIAKLDGSIANSLRRLQSVNVAIAAESARNPLVQSDTAYESVTARLDDLDSQSAFAQAALANDEAAREALSANPTLAEVGRFETLQNDSTYHELTAATAKDAAALATTKAAYTTRYPGLPGLIAQVQAERQASRAREAAALASPDAFSPTLAANDLQARKDDATIAGDRAKIAAIGGLLTTTEAHLSNLPNATATAQQLKLQQEAAQADYLTLTSHRTIAIASRAEALSLGSVVVVDRAVRADANVVGLAGFRLAVVAFALVMGFALGSAFLAEQLDPHLRRPSQIETLYGLNLIATLSMER